MQCSRVVAEDQLQGDTAVETQCPVPIVHLKSDTLEADSSTLLAERAYVDSLLTVLPVSSSEICLINPLPIFSESVMYF